MRVTRRDQDMKVEAKKLEKKVGERETKSSRLIKVVKDEL